MTFAAWMNKLDLIVLSALGQSVYDLPDMCFADAFECGDSPEEFAEQEIGIGKDGEIDFDRLLELD